MTVSMFDAYMERAEVARIQRIMDGGQSAIYAQATAESRRQLWNSWTNAITRNTTKILQRLQWYRKGTIITWNGVEMGREQLVNQFKVVFGRRSVKNNDL